MELLKVKGTEALFCDESGAYKLVSQITPEDISVALGRLLSGDHIEIASEEDENKIANPAQKIIFQQLRTSFKEVLDSRGAILEEVDSVFSEAEEKYLS